jgi:hypothetical protein
LARHLVGDQLLEFLFDRIGTRWRWISDCGIGIRPIPPEGDREGG